MNWFGFGYWLKGVQLDSSTSHVEEEAPTFPVEDLLKQASAPFDHGDEYQSNEERSDSLSWWLNTEFDHRLSYIETLLYGLVNEAQGHEYRSGAIERLLKRIGEQNGRV